jgi:hypothetical protein
MNANRINLAGSFVWNAQQRRTLYRLMLVYLLLASVLLAVTANRVTFTIQKSLELKRQSQAIQQRFIRQYVNQPDMEAYAGLLKDKLQKQAMEVSSIHAALPGNIYSVLPLLHLLVDPAQSGRINKLSFEQKGKESSKPELIFSVMIPEDTAEESAEAPPALQRWTGYPVLVREFSAMTPTTTEQGTVDGELVSILKYKAVFREN